MKKIHPQVLRLIELNKLSPPQRTPEWYAMRQTMMTASNAASALGIKPYASYSGDIRNDTIKQIVYGTFKGNAATQHGNEWEDRIRDMFCDISGMQVEEFGLMRHPTLPWLGASPDGISMCGSLVEIKAPYKRQIVPGHPPHHYLPQVQVQLQCCDLQICYFVQFQPAHLSSTGQEVLDITPIERDDAWFERALPKLKSFYDDLMKEREYARLHPPKPPQCLIRDDLYDDLDDERPAMFHVD